MKEMEIFKKIIGVFTLLCVLGCYVQANTQIQYTKLAIVYLPSLFTSVLPQVYYGYYPVAKFRYGIIDDPRRRLPQSDINDLDLEYAEQQHALHRPQRENVIENGLRRLQNRLTSPTYEQRQSVSSDYSYSSPITYPGPDYSTNQQRPSAGGRPVPSKNSLQSIQTPTQDYLNSASVGGQRAPVGDPNRRTGVQQSIRPIPALEPKHDPQLVKYASPITKFGINLLKTIDAANTENVAVSPFSIALVLALLQQGARGPAQTQITRALGMSPQLSAEAFFTFTNLFQKRRSKNLLQIATSLFISPNFDLEREYKMNALKYFESEINLLDFRNPTNAAAFINHWVASNTKQKIKEIVNPDAISEDAKVVIANAIVFKGLWQNMFNPSATQNGQFRLSNGMIKTAPFMKLRHIFKSDIDRKAKVQFVIIPFEDNQYSLMLLLPAVGQELSSAINRIDEVTLAQYQNAPDKELELQIPKFTARTDIDLYPVLNKLGIRDIFNPQLSNLESIGRAGGVAPHISSAQHSAMLTIDENGGSAAAATAFAAVALTYDEADVFLANRPFLAVLWDNEANVPLFMVKVQDPTV